MPQIIAAVLAAIQILSSNILAGFAVTRMQSGEYLRMHVVAQDDTAEMQRIKLCVRDAVQDCFLLSRDASLPTMQSQASAILPLLAEAACARAAEEGFTGDVTVTLGTFSFNDRELDGMAVPAGEYPALMILLGDAKGQNWWGLLDPETSLRFAGAKTQGSPIQWDWSLKGLLRALLGPKNAASAT